MSRHYTAEEVERRYVDAMGDELGRTFYELFNECAGLHGKWKEYVALFGTDEDRVHLLNKAAPAFFKLVQDSLFEDVLLHIARLTDRRRETLTVQRLPQLVKPALVAEVEGGLKIVLEKAEFVRDWRNRHMAHRSLALALQQGAMPLVPASRLAVRESLAAIAALLNAVEAHYCDNTPVGYDFFLGAPGDAEDLVRLLTDAVEARDTNWRR